MKNNVREKKGNSLIDLIHNYVVLDLETTGYDCFYDEIIEMAAIRVRNNEIVDTFSTLVKPECEINSFISNLTGITNNMVKNSPKISECIDDLINFIDNDITVGYNVNFDINFIYDNYLTHKNKYFSNDFIDVMRIARRVHPELEHHRLKDMSYLYKISAEGAHRSLRDCEICKLCYDMLCKEIIEKSLNIKNLKTNNHINYSKIIESLVPIDGEVDKNNLLYGKVCCFTGTLELMSRKDALQLVVNLGGIPTNTVTKKTNYLILGNNEYCTQIKDGKSIKQKRAEQLIIESNDLTIISEQTFYEIVQQENGVKK